VAIAPARLREAAECCGCADQVGFLDLAAGKSEQIHPNQPTSRMPNARWICPVIGIQNAATPATIRNPSSSRLGEEAHNRNAAR
jgi:hypothetical protein